MRAKKPGVANVTAYQQIELKWRHRNSASARMTNDDFRTHRRRHNAKKKSAAGSTPAQYVSCLILATACQRILGAILDEFCATQLWAFFVGQHNIRLALPDCVLD